MEPELLPKKTNPVLYYPFHHLYIVSKKAGKVVPGDILQPKQQNLKIWPVG